MAPASSRPLSTEFDFGSCKGEPGSPAALIEPYGILLNLSEADLRIVQVSANTPQLLGSPPESLLGSPLEQLLGPCAVEKLRRTILVRDLEGKPEHLSPLFIEGASGSWEGSVHRYKGHLLLELEPLAEETGPSPDELNADLVRVMRELQDAPTLDLLCHCVVTNIRRLTQFDRVMIYAFLEDGSGRIVAESSRECLPSYLGIHYTTPDLSAQVRRLDPATKVQIKPDVNAPGVPLVPPLNPITSTPPDLACCTLRELSGAHIENLQSMQVAASMTIPVSRARRLWGFIACHHLEPKLVPRPVRTACESLARFFSSQLSAVEEAETRNYEEQLLAAQQAFAEKITPGMNLQALLYAESENLAASVGADGFAFCLEHEVTLWGSTPTEAQTRALAEWVKSRRKGDIFRTDRLPALYPAAREFQAQASGLLAACPAPDMCHYLFWFRREHVRTIHRGGHPAPAGDFALWEETLHGRSLDWREADVNFAGAIRHSVAEALLHKLVDDVTRLNQELARSNSELDIFAYAASHDLQEPLRAIRTYGQLLARQTEGILDQEAAGYLHVMQDAAVRLSHMITSLLRYAKLGGAAVLTHSPVEVEEVLTWTRLNLEELINQTNTEITHGELPEVQGNEEQLVQLFQNLVGNAIKYRRPDEPPRIHIEAKREGAYWQFSVTDNGEGFPADQSERIFEVFERLHGYDMSGTGLGLSISRRIVQHHGGRIWAESEPGKGSTFYFTLAAE